MPLPDHVAAGELIASAWGNLVVDTLTTHDANIASDRLPNTVAGSTVDRGQLQMVANSVVVTTNASGDATIAFPYAFPGVVVVLICNGDGSTEASTGVGIEPSVLNVAATFFYTRVRRMDTGGPIANGTVRLNYLAIGRR